MDYFKEVSSFSKKRKGIHLKKKKNKDKDNEEFQFSSTDSGDANKTKKYSKKENKVDYLKPVKFVSGGFLNTSIHNHNIQGNKNNYNINSEDNNSSSSSSSEENETTDCDMYDVFKKCTFNFDFQKKEKDNYVKKNLEKYHLKELKKGDAQFEQYGLGFQILKKMGYEDGIGKQNKTNISPIELKKTHIKVIEEKKGKEQQYSTYHDFKDVFYYDENVFDQEDTFLNEPIGFKNAWEKKEGEGIFAHWKNRVRSIKNRLKVNSLCDMFPCKEEIKEENYEEHQEEEKRSINNRQGNTHSKLQTAKSCITEYIKHTVEMYNANETKKKKIKNKIKHGAKILRKELLYEIQVVLLKNIVTYKYLLNLHTLLPYEALFKQRTYNEFIFLPYQEKRKYLREKESPTKRFMENESKEKLINFNLKDERECEDHSNELKNAHSICYNKNMYEQKLNDRIHEDIKILQREGFYKESNLKKQEYDFLNNVKYKKINSITELFQRIHINTIQLRCKNEQIGIRDLFTFIYFIHQNANFLDLNHYVSAFFLEFLRMHFLSKNIQNEEEQGQLTKNHQTVESKKEIILDQAEIKYWTHFKSMILMGIKEEDRNKYKEIEREIDNIIYFNLINPYEKDNYSSLFAYLQLFRTIFNKNYYKKIILHFVKSNILTNRNQIENSEYHKEELDEQIEKEMETKIEILFKINKQFNIFEDIKKYYFEVVFLYLLKSEITEHYIKLIQFVAKNSICIKEMYDPICKRIISYLKDIQFNDDKILSHLQKVLLLYNVIDNNILFFILKIYFFYAFAKFICNYLRNLEKVFDTKRSNESEGEQNKTKIKEKMEMNETKTQNPYDKTQMEKEANNDEIKKQSLQMKKKEIYEFFKKFKNVFQNNIMQHETIKNIMFQILKVINTYVSQNKIITFPVQLVLDFDKTKLISGNHGVHYFVYKKIKIEVPPYGVPQKKGILPMIDVYKEIRTNEETKKNDQPHSYKFSKKKYNKFINKIEQDIQNEMEKKHYNRDDMNVKQFLEKYSLDNDILFVRKQNRQVNGKVVYTFDKYSIYINNNVIYIYQNNQWDPITLRDLINKL